MHMKILNARKYSIHFLLFMLVVILLISACNKDENPLPQGLDYKQEMRNFVQEISAYSKAINPDFAVIPQNGSELVSNTGNDLGSPDIAYINAIDGIGQEDLFYGYNSDNEPTPVEDNLWISSFLNMAKSNGVVKIMVTDYCSTPSKMDHSYGGNNARGYISFAADHRELDNIPDYPSQIYNANSDTVQNLQDAKNFLYLINPDNLYASRQAFVDTVKNTNYDFIIMDFFFSGEEFSPVQISQLKQKANGGQRLLISYLSIGEAEDYRYYWNSNWSNEHPSWLEKEDPNWQGNFYVRYWVQDWKSIIFGNDSSYLKKILDAGFDGVYLDSIDTFEFFEGQ